MITRKGLNALAEALGQEFAAVGLAPTEAGLRGLRVADALRYAGAVTPQFDSIRFVSAVEEAARR